MTHHNVLVREEEEDIGPAMQKLDIPFTELENIFSDSNLKDGLREIIEVSNLLPDDSDQEFEVHKDDEYNDISSELKPLENPSDSSTVKRDWSSLGPKPRKNKRGRPKKLKKPLEIMSSSDFDSDNIGEKNCLHCGTSNTPLWREGPRGPGTLCNACGLRYRTGRLLPEYRPASSVGFKSNLHSNFHRKVMDIRRERKSPSL
ncbi:unnamed protein product [Cochlearia groenlandica]